MPPSNENTSQNVEAQQEPEDALSEDPVMCSICHNEPPVNAIQLNCGHIFCFLCIKSVAEIAGCCALCRAEIGLEFNFQEHQILGLAQVPSPDEQDSYWFYEGFRGWWLYDADTTREINKARARGESQLERFISGNMYVIDLAEMQQFRKDGEGRSRSICHATLDLDNILGMAGLKGQDFDEILTMMKTARRNQMNTAH